jgi:hypothetical protein
VVDEEKKKVHVNDVKRIAEEHLKRELDIFEMILEMPDEDVKEYGLDAIKRIKEGKIKGEKGEK